MTYAEAVRDALDVMLRQDQRVIAIGLGVPDVKGFFGTTTGLQDLYGVDRVFDMPCAENAMTGVVLGAALNGLRPVLNHQRLDFALLAMDPLCTQAAKWHYMFGGSMRAPIVVRMLIGRGWGQGPQHSQCLHSWFSHIPGLKVVMPTRPSDAKGLLVSAIADDNPVVVLEHRWLHQTVGEVPEGLHSVPIGPLRIARPGKDITLAAFSYMVLECLRAAEVLAEVGIDAEVLDLRSVRPLDKQGLVQSVQKTGHLVVADHAWPQAGLAAECIACVAEAGLSSLKSSPKRVTFPDCPTPTSPSLSAAFYPTAQKLVEATTAVLNIPTPPWRDHQDMFALDKPDPSFTGPF
jgi:pyruvate/2-oxoglutarate/acetoin dehydrogenase E1 component